MINLNTLKKQYDNIRKEIKVYKPEFKLAKIKTEIDRCNKELENLKSEIEMFKKDNKLIDLSDVYVLNLKDKILFTVKNYATIKDNVTIDNYQGIYQGYFTDLFTNNVICHFKETIDYENENFKINIIGLNFKGAMISSILDYVNINDINDGQINLNLLKKIYLKTTKRG